MTLNAYSRSNTEGYIPTQDMYENLIIESIQFSGQHYYYIPRTLSGRFDQIFGEDVLSSFDSYAEIEMYLQDFTGLGGEAEMISKFGLEIRSSATFIVSRKRYVETVTPIVPADRNSKLKTRPCEGDLIYAPFSKSLFEIKFCEDDTPGFYQLNKKHVYSLRCELVQLNNETFNTGNAEVDDYYNQNLNRLNNKVLTQTGFTIITQTGGCLLNQQYVFSEQYSDNKGYGDDNAIKKEFMNIMDFSSDNPFNELF